MATAVVMETLFLRSYMQYSTELQKLIVGYIINPMRCWLCYGKQLQSHLVPRASPLLHGEGRVWLTEYIIQLLSRYTGCCIVKRTGLF